MFITRKEFEELKALVHVHRAETDAVEKHLIVKINLLADELGYEWTSEAVKEDEMGPNEERYRGGMAGIMTWPYEVKVGEKAVLKWGWKKIKEDDFTEEWERQVEGKKLNSKSK